MDKLLIGEVLKPQGIKGEIKAKIYNESLNSGVGDVFEIEGRKYTIHSLSMRSGFLFVKFEEINSIDQAEKLRSKGIFLPDASKVQKLKQNQLFVEEILSFDVFLSNGDLIGKFDDLQNFGSKDIMYITGKKEILVPIVSGLIDIVDRSQKSITLNEKIFSEVACYED